VDASQANVLRHGITSFKYPSSGIANLAYISFGQIAQMVSQSNGQMT